MRAYERFLQYVGVHTTSDPTSATHPTTARQFDLANRLAEEMKALGISHVRVDEHCYVYGVIPATPGYESAHALGFIAHMDTTDDAPGDNIKPILHENYDGGDVTLPGSGATMHVAEFPFLAGMKGQTLITTDGTTLLGADDKAGIAEILTMAERVLTENRPHGKICIGFTPDEEVGQGADLFDIEGFGADFAYTVDGGDVNEINYENFNAAAAVVTVHGFSVHPGSAKDKMKNAMNIAIEFHNALPEFDRPEHTEGYEGFIHLEGVSATCEHATARYIVRDHDATKFDAKIALIERAAAFVSAELGGDRVTVEIKQQYRNMAEIVADYPELIELAKEAFTAAGVEPHVLPIRGGTDGAQLSFRGLPCPNLSTGGYCCHGVNEFIPVSSLEKMVDVLEALVARFA